MRHGAHDDHVGPQATRHPRNRVGRFPREEIARVIDGLSPFAAHGTRNMPVSGYEFFDPRLEDREAEAEVNERVDRLVEYLASIQQKGDKKGTVTFG